MAHIMEHQEAQVRTLVSSSAPGFDTVLPPFIQHACKLVPRHHGRAAELAPKYKRGPVTYPSNYRMLAASIPYRAVPQASAWSAVASS
eukprot:1148031-Pelagomonas_calceolata.AAC.2